MDNKISETIKNRRIELGLTYNHVAIKSGLTSMTIYNIEKGKKITYKSLKKVCDAIGLIITIEKQNENI